MRAKANQKTAATNPRPPTTPKVMLSQVVIARLTDDNESLKSIHKDISKRRAELEIARGMVIGESRAHTRRYEKGHKNSFGELAAQFADSVLSFFFVSDVARARDRRNKNNGD
jgi:hypothetical protein